MRLICTVFASLCLVSCGGTPPTDDSMESNDSSTSFVDKRAVAPELPKVAYPSCKDVWRGERLSACGRKVFRTSLVACQTEASKKVGAGAALLDEYTGDSWQMRAGGAAIESIDDRLKHLTRSAQGEYVEGFAFALGNGTDEIQHVYCDLDTNLRLENVT